MARLGRGHADLDIDDLVAWEGRGDFVPRVRCDAHCLRLFVNEDAHVQRDMLWRDSGELVKVILCVADSLLEEG